jgi:hypothetical protein
MKRAIAIAVALAVVATAAFAGGNIQHKVAIHLKAHPTSCATGYPSFGSCSDIAFTVGSCGDLDALPVFFDLTEYTMVEAGLTWPADWGTMSWVRCRGDAAAGDIVDPGDGTAISWTVCQTGWSVAPGYGWVTSTSPGMVCPVPNPATGDFGVVDCAPAPGPYYDYPLRYYCAGACGMIGDDPCVYVGPEGSSWGRIKSIFE